MEFDSSVRMKPRCEFKVESDLELEAFVGEVWKVASKKSSNVGDAGCGELWLDRSTLLCTRYISVTSTPEDGGFGVSIKSGFRQSRVLDALTCILGLLIFWCVGHSLTPNSSLWYVCVESFAGAVLMTLCIVFRIGFSDREINILKSDIQSLGKSL